jgi:CRP/FNR family transcriptional regulator
MSVRLLKSLQPLLDEHVKRQIGRHSTILYQGEVPRSVCIVGKGMVKASNFSAQGEEQLISFHIVGELFPTPWLFEKTNSTLYFYEAVTPCEIYFVPRQNFHDFINAHIPAQQELMAYMAGEYTGSLLRINALEQAKAREKITYTLYYLSQRYGKAERGGWVGLSLSLTHQQLAGLVGLTRETTATELNRLKRKKVIRYLHQTYMIDMKALLLAIGEDSFQDIQLH